LLKSPSSEMMEGFLCFQFPPKCAIL
jgi:hypothetical protein